MKESAESLEGGNCWPSNSWGSGNKFEMFAEADENSNFVNLTLWQPPPHLK